MNPGDRVTTPKGPGTLKGHYIDQRWVRNRTDIITWAAVKLDGNEHPTMFHPATIQEATMTTMQEPNPQPQPDEPQPDPNPQPEPIDPGVPTGPPPDGSEDDDDTDEDDDSRSTRRTITVEDEELVGQANLIEWP